MSSRLLSEVLASVQDSVQKEMGLGIEGLRHQLSELIASPQAPDIARTQVGDYDADRNVIKFKGWTQIPLCIMFSI